ncbi:MAG: TetR family transcriptional regulator [Pseudomonadota bacterium]
MEDLVPVDSDLRTTPVQARSRDRLQSVLRSAEAVIAEKGTDALKLSEVAARAKIPIGAVYNFFPNRTALIAHLLRVYLAKMTNDPEVSRLFDAPQTTRAGYLQNAVHGLVAVHAFVRRHRVFREIWSGAQAFREIRAIDLADSRDFASRLSERLRPLNPKLSAADLFAKSLLICHLCGSTMRLAENVEDDLRRDLVASFIRMALAHMGFRAAEIDKADEDISKAVSRTA